MSTEFGLNGHPQEFTQKPESSTAELIRQMQRTAARLQERKPDGVRMRVVNLNWLGSFLEKMESRHVIPSEFDGAPINSFRESSLGIVIHNPVQLRIDFTATTGEVRNAPEELQELFGEMGTVLFFPINTAFVMPYSAKGSEDFGVVFAPAEFTGDKVGVILSSDSHCDATVIGNGATKQRKILVDREVQLMRSTDNVDHKYSGLMISAGFWIANVLNERMDYC